MTQRADPPFEADEKTMLSAFLDYHRATLLMKVDGVSDHDLRRPMVESGTCLLGLVKHLAYVEHWWFHGVFSGLPLELTWPDDDPDIDFHLQPDDTPTRVVALYRAEMERSRQLIASASPDDHARGPVPPDKPKPQITLRWILVHMIEETARHNGHADILREQIDGVTGE